MPGANARAVLDDLDARGTNRAVLVGHSFGGGVALSAASRAPHRVEAVVLLASVGPGCVNGWDSLVIQGVVTERVWRAWLAQRAAISPVRCSRSTRRWTAAQVR
jgi:pimeloyl-ACP methyl ester carboxylesterase